MRERELEQQFRLHVKRAGGIALKLVCPGFAGMPDRLVLMPNGHIFLAEIKRPGERARPLQKERHRMLKELGFRVFVIDSPEKEKEAIDEIYSTSVPEVCDRIHKEP